MERLLGQGRLHIRHCGRMDPSRCSRVGRGARLGCEAAVFTFRLDASACSEEMRLALAPADAPCGVKSARNGCSVAPCTEDREPASPRTAPLCRVTKALHESVAEDMSSCFLVVSAAEDSKILER